MVTPNELVIANYLRSIDLRTILNSKDLRQAFLALSQSASSCDREAFVQLLQADESRRPRTPPPDPPSDELNIVQHSDDYQHDTSGSTGALPDIGRESWRLNFSKPKGLQDIDKRIISFVESHEKDKIIRNRLIRILHQLTGQTKTFDNYADIWAGDQPIYASVKGSRIFNSVSALRLHRIVQAQRKAEKSKKLKECEIRLNALYFLHEYELNASPKRRFNLPAPNDNAWLQEKALELGEEKSYLIRLLERARSYQTFAAVCGNVELLELSHLSNNE
ncbi:hypothetical protein L228DRAFT_246975 [Xylona heveae TC161]|uniref:Uncharacterized protein n=1 Tax=Xylona heveae (strain CBS 132557 / TC161) TaxID=1328760 RepID=A0A165GUX4_XYLHT|nr:hypothetical protein L228DRAFT_246975 [Xylona heveae TC161]KZF22626.1 hypothetical protein L228DRAFT_246975 [Xylona heveae TC161]